MVDLENFATASHRGDIHNSSVVGLFMTPIGQRKPLDRVMVECSGVTATPGKRAPPEGPRPGQGKFFFVYFRLVIKKIKIYIILNFTCG